MQPRAAPSVQQAVNARARCIVRRRRRRQVKQVAGSNSRRRCHVFCRPDKRTCRDISACLRCRSCTGAEAARLRGPPKPLPWQSKMSWIAALLAVRPCMLSFSGGRSGNREQLPAVLPRSRPAHGSWTTSKPEAGRPTGWSGETETMARCQRRGDSLWRHKQRSAPSWPRPSTHTRAETKGVNIPRRPAATATSRLRCRDERDGTAPSAATIHR